MSEEQEDAIVKFMKTLSAGYQTRKRADKTTMRKRGCHGLVGSSSIAGAIQTDWHLRFRQPIPANTVKGKMNWESGSGTFDKM